MNWKGVTVYRCTKMTGRLCSELLEEAYEYDYIFKCYGIKLLDPVLIEGIPFERRPLEALPDPILSKLWARDKECLLEANVAVNTNATLKSVGCEHEQGIMRFGYWKPLVLVYPWGSSLPYIARHEDDLVADCIDAACEEIVKRWGTYPRRLEWRLKMLGRSLPKFVYRQAKFLVQ